MRHRAFAVGVVSLTLLVLGLFPVQAGEAGWGPVEEVSAHRVGAHPPALEVETRPDGSAVAAWWDFEAGEHGRLYVAGRAAGGGWSAPRVLVRATVYFFDLAVGPDGSASVVWQRSVGGIERIEERHSVAGDWSPLRTIGRGVDPAVAIDGDGDTIAVWGGSALNLARRPADGAWTDPRQLAGKPARGIAVDSNAAGDSAVVWWQFRRGDGLPWQSWGKVFRRGEWRPAHRIFRSQGANWPWPAQAHVEIGPAGRALMTAIRHLLRRPGGYRNAVVWSRSRVDGTWSGRRFLTRELLEDGGRLSLAMNASGQALATWERVDSHEHSVEVARFRRDATWGRPRRLGGRALTSIVPWLDDSGVGHVVGQGRRGVVAYSQRPEHDWTGPMLLGKGELLDVSGAGHRVIAMWAGRHLEARPFDSK